MSAALRFLGVAALVVGCSSEPSSVHAATDASLDVADAASDVASSDVASNDVALDAKRPPCADGVAPGFEAGAVPKLLSQTGWGDTSTKTVGPRLVEFTPQYALWSDGAEKRRWVELPEGCAIDSSDMDHWVLPVGTKLWKEFVVDGKRIETRIVVRFGPGPDDFTFAAYAWRDDESDAEHVPNGVLGARGTKHDVPATSFCKSCHGYLPERALGFSALQLSHVGDGVTLAKLGATLTDPAPTGTMRAFAAPGDATASAALGHLHANCGNCHNESGIAFLTPFSLRLSVWNEAVEATPTWKTAVGVPVEKAVVAGVTHRIARGNAAASCITARMSIRGSTQQMPPIASKVVDAAGLAKVQAWIDSL